MSLYQNDFELSSQLGFPDQESGSEPEPEPAPFGPGYDHSLDWSDINRKFRRHADYSGLGNLVRTDDSEAEPKYDLVPPNESLVRMIHLMYADQKHAIEQGYPMAAADFRDYVPRNVTESERVLVDRHIQHLTTLETPPETAPKSVLEHLEQRKRGDRIGKLALDGRLRGLEKPVSHAGTRDVEALKKEITALKEVGNASKAEIIEYLEQDARHLSNEQAQIIGTYVESLYVSADNNELAHS